MRPSVVTKFALATVVVSVVVWPATNSTVDPRFGRVGKQTIARHCVLAPWAINQLMIREDA